MSQESFFIQLIDDFKDKASSLQSQASQASIYENRSDIGTAREDALFDFLTTHIPARCNVIKGGFVFDSMGNRSSQIDLMVCNDQTFQFKQSGNDNKTKSFNCVEGCFAVISVKSHLNKTALFDSLDNLASVSTIKKIKVNAFITNASDLLDQIPQRIIFAYSGDDMYTVNKNCTEYYSTDAHKLQPKPDFILVNNEYYFSRAGVLGHKIPTGEIIPYGQYTMIDKEKSQYGGGVGLFLLISRILTVSTLSPHMEIDFKNIAIR